MPTEARPSPAPWPTPALSFGGDYSPEQWPHETGGAAWYLSTDLDPAGLGAFVDQVLSEAAVTPAAVASAGVEVVRRVSPAGSYLFLLNHAVTPGWAEATGVDLLTGARYEVRVIREE